MERALEGNVSPCIRDDLIRCKISMDKVRIYDTARERIEAPKAWRGWHVNAMIKVRGKWQTRTQTGLCLETTDIQLLEEAREPACPF